MGDLACYGGAIVNYIHAVLFAITHNFGAIIATFGLGFIALAYKRGEMQAFFAFLKDVATDSTTGHASTKSLGYLFGAITICWSFIKITLATCRRIDDSMNPLDPSTILMAELGVIATLVGGTYIAGKYIAAKQAPDGTSTLTESAATTSTLTSRQVVGAPVMLQSERHEEHREEHRDEVRDGGQS